MPADKGSINVSIGASGYYGLAASAFTAETIQKIQESLSFIFDFGTGANQADLVYSSLLSISSSGTTLEFSGGVVDKLGNTLTFAEICLILIKNKNTTDNQILLVGGNALNPFTSWVADASDKVKVYSSGALLLGTAMLTGYSVGGSSGRLLLASASAGYSVSTEILVIGRSS